MGGLQSSGPDSSSTIKCQPIVCCCSAIRKCPPIWWLTSLDEVERSRLAGTALSCVATILVMIAISTEFWVKRFVRGIFVSRGLWIDCQMGSCARPGNVHLYVVGSIILMLISVVTSYGSMVCGTLSFTPLPRLKAISWPWLATTLCFISGITGAMGLYNYMRFSTTQSGSYLSWSLMAGWLAVILVFIAGICYFWASRWEKELLNEHLCTSRTLLTLAEECRLKDSEASMSRKRNTTSETSV